MGKIDPKRNLVEDVTLLLASGLTSALVYFSLRYLDGKYKKKAKYTLPSALRGCAVEKEISESISCALYAGDQMIKCINDKSKSIEHKGDIDLVTATDKANEDYIIGRLSNAFPNHKFIGEETASSSEEGIPPLTDDITFIIDPIDGTTNFVHSFPFSCVSIGIAKDKKVIAGIVYDPYQDELFLACKDHGAYCNNKSIQVSTATSLNKAQIIQEFGYERSPQGIDEILFRSSQIMLEGVRSFRQMGSGVLDLVYLACGRVDGIYAGIASEGWKPWDYAAGFAIASEAGAVFCNIKGGDFDIYGSSIVATNNKELQRKLLKCLTCKRK